MKKIIAIAVASLFIVACSRAEEPLYTAVEAELDESILACPLDAFPASDRP